MCKIDIAGVERSVIEEILVTRVTANRPLSTVLSAADLHEI